MSAYNLFLQYEALGCVSWMAVGKKKTQNPNIYEIPRREWPQWWFRQCKAYQEKIGLHHPHIARLLGYASVLPSLNHYLAKRDGREDFHFSGTRRILGMLPSAPDVIHCHNLHTNYFDIRALPSWSRRSNLVLNMRDSWLLTGHCAYPGDCARWRIGCGSCPDLERYVRIEKDASAFNWRVKMDAIQESRYYLTAPSRWQLDQALAAPLGHYAVEAKVIPNGIDTSIFSSVSTEEARARLGLASDRFVILMTAHHTYKDTDTMFAALTKIRTGLLPKRIMVICLGTVREPMKLGGCEVHFTGYVSDKLRLRDYYCASDIYIHAAEGEAFGKTITESMSCGTPVVATRTGGIPEQVVDGRVGYLVGHKDSENLARRVEELLLNENVRKMQGACGVEHVRKNYTLEIQAKRFLAWFAGFPQIDSSGYRK